ncbi:MAG: hypothetical protein K9L23_20555, partial [Desulfotignum sp.]|nr:hypothetical protein [Desulfotignum sp.]
LVFAPKNKVLRAKNEVFLKQYGFKNKYLSGSDPAITIQAHHPIPDFLFPELLERGESMLWLPGMSRQILFMS